ncbi:hypothetical protein M5689_011239 [Euphorbia peplus]|nr:hypothetical protein M5689_011239 [Euphorbia peplus]
MNIDSEFMETLNLPLKRWFNSQSWLSMLTLRDKIYPDLVYEFYKTMSALNNGTFMFKIGDKDFIIDDIILGSVLGIPYTKKRISRHDLSLKIGAYSYYRFVRKIFKINANQPIPKILRRSRLEPELEILHYFMTRVLIHVKSNLGTMTTFDIYFIWNVTHFVNVMLEHMSSLRIQDDWPYGMLITSVFRHFRIDLEGRKTIECNRCLGKTEIYKMLVRYKEKTERDRISREILCTPARNPDRFKLFVRNSPKRKSLDIDMPSLYESITSESSMSKDDSSNLSINLIYVNELNLQKKKGIMSDLKANSAVENKELTQEEMDLMNSIADNMEKPPSSSGFILPNCPIYIDADNYQPASQETTPMFFTQQNLQSDFLEEVEPSFPYKFTTSQIVNLSGHLRNMYGDVNQTSYNLDSHSKFLASTMAQAEEMSQRMVKQTMNVEAAIANMSAKMDFLCTFVQDRLNKQSLALKDLSNKIDDQHGRVFALHTNQQFLLGRQEDVIAAIRQLQNGQEELTTAIKSIPGVTMNAEPSPPASTSSDSH